MKTVASAELTQLVKELCLEANRNVRPDVLKAIKETALKENGKLVSCAYHDLLENIKVAKSRSIALCQDSGTVTVFIKTGEGVLIEGRVTEAVNRGVREAYREGYFRKSVVKSPLSERKNTGDNTPATVYLEEASGPGLSVEVLVKGAGSENMSFLKMLTPACTKDELLEYIVSESLARAPFCCPPVILGVGIGGTFDSAALLSKQALLKPLGYTAGAAEKELARGIMKGLNSAGIGASGYPGKVLALGVNILTKPAHMASLPVAVNLNCWALRTARGKLTVNS